MCQLLKSTRHPSTRFYTYIDVHMYSSCSSVSVCCCLKLSLVLARKHNIFIAKVRVFVCFIILAIALQVVMKFFVIHNTHVAGSSATCCCHSCCFCCSYLYCIRCGHRLLLSSSFGVWLLFDYSLCIVFLRHFQHWHSFYFVLWKFIWVLFHLLMCT